MAKVKIGLIAKRFVTNSKLIPKRGAHQKIAGRTCAAAMQSMAGIAGAMRVSLRNSARIHVTEWKHIEMPHEAMQRRTRQFLPGAV
ncbi:MAG: hypothetical protein ACRCV5_09590 [Afipia sp.]